VDLQDVIGQPLGEARNPRPMVPARGDDDPIGDQIARARLKLERSVDAAERADGDSLADGRPERGRVRLEVVDDLLLSHEALRIRSRVGEAGERALPVRRDQAERIPAALAPFGGDSVTLQYDVVDPARLQPMTHREARLARADDGDANSLCGALLHVRLPGLGSLKVRPAVRSERS
jgi:hypothetical protein